MIVAHGHGGTVAAQTIQEGSPLSLDNSFIKALICLSTSFAYPRLSSSFDEKLFLIAFGEILTVPIVLVLSSFWETWWFLPAALVIVPVILGPVLLSFDRWRSDGEEFRSSPPIFQHL